MNSRFRFNHRWRYFIRLAIKISYSLDHFESFKWVQSKKGALFGSTHVFAEIKTVRIGCCVPLSHRDWIYSYGLEKWSRRKRVLLLPPMVIEMCPKLYSIPLQGYLSLRFSVFVAFKRKTKKKKINIPVHCWARVL